ncbi:hypothetical protein Tco_1434972 [Tanacetum coccineum]
MYEKTKGIVYNLIDTYGYALNDARAYYTNRRQQDKELDELSASVERIGSVGHTIHDELIARCCERIIEELGTKMDSTSNRLDFVQAGLLKKVAVVMNKASAKMLELK